MPSDETYGVDALVDVRVDSLSERFTVGSVLGEGRFSEVVSAVRTTGDGGVVALKGIAVSVLHADAEALEMLQAEVAALRQTADHEELRSRVVKLHEIVMTPDTLFLVMERVPGRELFQVIEDEGALSEPLARRLMFELVSALAAMHALGVVHRDIKPENLIVSGLDDVSAARLVVIDFGYAAIVSVQDAQGLAGSPEYAAPEVLSWLEAELRPGEVSGQPYSGSCDMWSLGVTAHVVLSAFLHFDLPEDEDADEIALVEAARDTELRFEQPVWMSEGMSSAKAFIQACMRTDPAARLSSTAALEHEWFTSTCPLRAHDLCHREVQNLNETPAPAKSDTTDSPEHELSAAATATAAAERSETPVPATSEFTDSPDQDVWAAATAALAPEPSETLAPTKFETKYSPEHDLSAVAAAAAVAERSEAPVPAASDATDSPEHGVWAATLAAEVPKPSEAPAPATSETTRSAKHEVSAAVTAATVAEPSLGLEACGFGHA